MQNDKLLPCPFCGGKAEWGTVLKTWIVCTSCGFETPYSKDTENTVRLWNIRKPMERIVETLKSELILADEEKERCTKENPLQFDTAKGYATGISNALNIVKGGVDNAG